MCTMVVVLVVGIYGPARTWYMDTPQEFSLHPHIAVYTTDFEWYAYSILVSILICCLKYTNE